MKLTRDLPDKEGCWWFWSKGMQRPRALRVQFFDIPRSAGIGPALMYDNGDVWKALCKTKYTHFAGPIERPELPEAPGMTVDELINVLQDVRRRHGNLKVCIDGHEMGDTIDPPVTGVSVGTQRTPVYYRGPRVVKIV